MYTSVDIKIIYNTFFFAYVHGCIALFASSGYIKISMEEEEQKKKTRHIYHL